MKRGRSCWRCEYLGQGYPAQDKSGGSCVTEFAAPVDMCQHPKALAMRTANQRILATEYAPHWCPKETPHA